jgi:hypothetical protein
MRYIDRTECKRMADRGKDSDIQKMGKLTRKATKIAEENDLGLLRTHWGTYRVIRACGLGAYMEDLKDLAAVDDFLKHLEEHEDSRIYTGR